MKADLHIHSHFSYDAIAKPETILQVAAERQIEFIAITDYDSTLSWQQFEQLAPYYPVNVIKGQEIKLFNGKYIDGEILALFLQKPIKSTTMEEIIEDVKAQGGLISIAHPFCDRRGEFRAFDQIDDWSHIAIEAKNGRIYKPRDNEMARGLADMMNLPVTAGSDAHTPFEIGSVYVEFDGASAIDLKNAILNRDVYIGGESASAFFSLVSHFGRLGISI